MRILQLEAEGERYVGCVACGELTPARFAIWEACDRCGKSCGFCVLCVRKRFPGRVAARQFLRQSVLWHRQQRHRPRPIVRVPRRPAKPKRRWSDPTPPQAHVLAFLRAFQADRGTAPTYQEMAVELKVTKQAIGQQVARLERKGWLQRQRGKRRGLTLKVPSDGAAHGG